MCKECLIKLLEQFASDKAIEFPYIHREKVNYVFSPIVIDAFWEFVEFTGFDWASGIINPYLNALAMEYPHPSEKFPGAIAYTRNAEYGALDRHVSCKPGGYLARVFPAMPGHMIEKLVCSYNKTESEYKILTNIDDIVNAMFDCADTCRSCMTKHNAHGWDTMTHPYRVYNPKFGWNMVIRTEKGIPYSRVLVNDKKYVRIYGTPTDSTQYSRPDDPATRQWLQDNGYTRVDGWDGLKVDKIRYNGSLLGPYMDGYNIRGTVGDDCIFISNASDNCSFCRTDGILDYEDHEGQIQDRYGYWINENESLQLDDGTYIREEEASYLDRYDAYYATCDTVVTRYPGALYDRELQSDCICVYVSGIGHIYVYHTHCYYDDNIGLYKMMEDIYRDNPRLAYQLGHGESYNSLMPTLNDRVVMHDDQMYECYNESQPVNVMGTVYGIIDDNIFRVRWDTGVTARFNRLNNTVLRVTNIDSIPVTEVD